jgi:anti-sigma B factor antagonist
MIKFTCPQCHAHLNVPDDKAGHSGHCPKCGFKIQIPEIPKPRQPLKPSGGSIQRAEADEIPLADERPQTSASTTSRPPQSSRIPNEPAGRGTEPADIPLTDKPAESEEKASAEPEPAATPAGLVITKVGQAIVVSLEKPRILDPMEIDPMGQELYALVDQRKSRNIILDFSKVQYLSSQILGVLMMLNKKSAGIKGRLLLCGLSNDLRNLFKIVSLDKVLQIVPNRQTALAMVNPPA